MKIIDVQQGSPEWLQARLGMPTASEFASIITPKTRKPSASQDKYLAKLCAEWFIGEPIDGYTSVFMERGTQMEPQAADSYAFARDVECSPVGFCTTDDSKIGCSPDRLVGDDGLLEIKCPGAEAHMRYLLSDGEMVADYWCQAQGELYVTGRAWVDLYSFNPVMPEVCVRVEPDEEFQTALHECLMAFVKKLDAAKEKLAPSRVVRPVRVVTLDTDPFATQEYPSHGF